MAHDSPSSFSVDEVREALARGQLLLVYQPIFDLHSGAFIGVEALIRWRHPVFGLLGPDALAEALEGGEVAIAILRWTLETACAQGAAWHDSGYRFRVSVNVSSGQWAREGLLEDVSDVLEATRFDPSHLVLEVATATLRADPDGATRLAALGALGVHRAVDDVVPDAEELTRLAALGVDVVKITPSAGALEAGLDEAALSALADRALGLGLQLIAAGIEEITLRDTLARERIGSGQGFALSEPREAEEIDRFLEDFAIFSGKPL